MFIRSLLVSLLIALISSTQQAQSESIACDLVNLYQITLSKSPVLQRQNIQYRISEAEKQSASSTFDYQLFSDLSLDRSGLNLFELDPRNDIADGKINTNSLTLSGGVQRTFRSGMTASAGLNYSRIGDNLPFNNYNQEVGPFFYDNNTSATLSIRQPLLRGRGRYFATANEQIANIGIERQQLTTQFVASGEVFNMAASYWHYLSASKSLEVYQANEARVREVLNITQELVNADKKPRSELLQVQADLKDKERQTISARQSKYTARQNLGRVLGLSNAESALIGIPLNGFPNVENIERDLDLNALVSIAHENRQDLKSLKKSLDMLTIYQDVAENNTRAQLDVKASVTYGGIDAGNGFYRLFSALAQSQGRNYQFQVGLSYVFPIQNNFAEADLLNNQLQYSDREIFLKNEIRNIELNVSIAYNDLLASIDALQKSKESLEYHQEVFKNEQYKFQTGLTTLLNLILFQERLTFAQLDYLNNQQQFAIAISNLRYETGTIFPDSKKFKPDSQFNTSEIFYTLPEK